MNELFFEKKVDMRRRADMVAFLAEHPRYNTMNSWNGCTSYAHCIKLHYLGLTREQDDRAWAFLGQDYWDEIREPIEEFTRRHHGQYTLATNGRSGGYLVLYTSAYESTGYLSYCPHCGQRNYKRVATRFEAHTAEAVVADALMKHPSQRAHHRWYLDKGDIPLLPLSESDTLDLIARLRPQLENASYDDRCGRCHNSPRINYPRSPTKLTVWPRRSIDQHEDFSDWSMEDLRRRVRLVCDFDRTVDEIRANFIALIDNCEIVEDTIMVPRKVSRIECRLSA